MSVNKVILVGNLGQDPETRKSQNDLAICNFSIATSRRKEDPPEWHKIVCFGKTAEAVVKYMTKGSQVYVEGRIQTNKWEDNDGNQRSTVEIVADQVRFLGGRDSTESKSNGRQKSTSTNRTQSAWEDGAF